MFGNWAVISANAPESAGRFGLPGARLFHSMTLETRHVSSPRSRSRFGKPLEGRQYLHAAR